MKHPGLLAIDIGNTNIKFGLWDGETWRRTWRVRTLSTATAEDYAEWFAFSETVTDAVISSVVPALTPVFSGLIHENVGITAPYLIDSQSATGLQAVPQGVGTDRLLNAAAAFALYRGNTIVVDLGTATKFDVVTAEGVYRGGAIAPGIGSMDEVLAQYTAQLPQIELAAFPPVIGTNTVAAMQSGITWGAVAMVEGMLARLKTSWDAPHIQVIATGGLVPLIQDHTTLLFDAIVPTLTLDGLRVVYGFQG